MNNKILRWRQIKGQRGTNGAVSSRERETPFLLKGAEFEILVDWYDVVTPFWQEGQEGQLTLPR